MAEILRYPDKAIHDDTDYLKIEVFDYVAVGFSTTGGQTSTSSKTNYKGKTIQDTILLPIPQNIQDSNGAGWGEDSINNVVAFGLGQVGDFIESPELLKGFGDLLKTTASEFGKVAVTGGAQNLNTAFFASKAVNILGGNTSFSGVLARSSGQILNPNTELLFNGVKLRSFNFSFDFAPRNSPEAEKVRKIIRTFKKSMSPTVTNAGSDSGAIGTGLFLRTPKIFQLSYMKGNSPHPFLNKFVPAALVNMNVNYTGSGTYMTYHDGNPVHMKMELSFQELSPVYESDYSEDDAGVGF